MITDSQIFFALMVALLAAILAIGLGRQLYVQIIYKKDPRKEKVLNRLFVSWISFIYLGIMYPKITIDRMYEDPYQEN